MKNCYMHMYGIRLDSLFQCGPQMQHIIPDSGSIMSHNPIKRMMMLIVVLLALSVLCVEAWQQSNLLRTIRQGTTFVKRFPLRHAVMADPDAVPEVNPTRRDPSDPASRHSVPIPVVTFKGGLMDINSRLLQERIIMVGQHIDDQVAQSVVAQLLHLSHDDPVKDITMYINCPGGAVSSTMAIFDMMEFIPNQVSTICVGSASSMGAFLLAAGTHGKRKAFPNSRIMLHQPLGEARGQAADIEIQTQEILFVRSQVNAHLSTFTQKPADKIEADCDRDFYMTPEQALEYGIIDQIVSTKRKTSHTNTH